MGLLVTLLALCAAALVPGLCAAQAAAAATPAQVVHEAVEGVIAAVKTDPNAHNGDAGRIAALVRQRFVPFTDFQRTTQLAVGRAWSEASPVQQHALFEQFQDLIVHTYASELTEITGQDLHFEYEPPATHGNETVVRTRLITPSDNDEIDYRLQHTASGWKIYDINILGAWMSTLYKHQFDSALARGGVDALIATLAEHNKRDAQ